MLISNGKTSRRRRKFGPNLAQKSKNPPLVKDQIDSKGGFFARITPDYEFNISWQKKSSILHEHKYPEESFLQELSEKLDVTNVISKR